MLNFIECDDILEHAHEYDVTLVAANIYASMSEGIAENIKQQFPYVYETNISTRYGDTDLYGKVIESKKEGNPTFALCYITKIKRKNTDTVNYEALSRVLRTVNNRYKGRKVATTLLGWDKFEGNGDKERIIKMFNDIITKLDMDIYIFQQDSHLSKWAKALKKAMELKDDKEKWAEYIKESKKKITKQKNANTTRTNGRPFKTYSVHQNKK